MLDMRMIDGEIAELERVFDSGSPTWNHVEKLAALYTIKSNNQMSEKPQPMLYSNAQAQTVDVDYGDSEFLIAVSEKDIQAVFEVMDSLMDTLKIVNPKVYNSIMAKIKRLQKRA